MPSSCCTLTGRFSQARTRPPISFCALERLGTAVLLDDAVLDLLDVLAARVALAAAEALAAAADAVAFLALARVDDLVAEIAAEGTFHLITPLGGCAIASVSLAISRIGRSSAPRAP